MIIAIPQYHLSTVLFSAFDYVIKGFTEDANIVIKWEDLAKQTMQDQMTTVSECFLDKLYRYVRYTFELDPSTAEDILQELFVHLPQKLKKAEKEKSIEPFLFKVTHNFVIDCLRKNKRYETNEGTKLPEEEFVRQVQSYDGDDQPNEEVEKVYKSSLIKVLIHKMSSKHRELIILFFFEHKSYEEIAVILGVKKSGVGTMMGRAKKEMQVLIEENLLLQQAIVYDL